AAHVDHALGAVGRLRREEREGDRPPEHRREVATRHLAHRHTVDHHRVVRTWRTAPVDQQPSEPPRDTTLTFGRERIATAELALVPPHDPTETGLQRRDP